MTSTIINAQRPCACNLPTCRWNSCRVQALKLRRELVASTSRSPAAVNPKPKLSLQELIARKRH